MASDIHIRNYRESDRDNLWSILEPTFRSGESYPVDQNISKVDGLTYWLQPVHQVFIAERNNTALGTYYLKANQSGGGSHVANCGYIVAPEATGHGIASAMCTHSQEQARQQNFRAMQFNFVISTNKGAVSLWQKHGFEIVGTLPKAYAHPLLGFVDAFVMYKTL
ncbi:MAG: GNAT family N-acetyltransferase [Candidatus Obscuribacterales bacterium]|nr:GNAT family N-acetyltransferase [Candidatus Obscuribacterales bacterium]